MLYFVYLRSARYELVRGLCPAIVLSLSTQCARSPPMLVIATLLGDILVDTRDCFLCTLLLRLLHALLLGDFLLGTGDCFLTELLLRLLHLVLHHVVEGHQF